MSTVRKIALNSLVIFAGRLASKLIGLATLLMLARYLGVEQFGQYTLIIVFCGFFLYFNDFGVTSVIVRKISQSKEDESELVSKAMTLKILFSILAVILPIFFMAMLGYPQELFALIFIYSLTLIPSSITALFNGVFQAKLSNQYGILSEIVNSAMYLFLLAILIYLKMSLFFILLAFLFSTIAALLTSWFFVRKRLKIKLLVDTKIWRSLFVEGFPFAFTQILSAIYYRIDFVLISKMLTDYSLGLYSAAFRLTEALSIIPSVLVLPLFPLMSSLFKTSIKNLEVSYNLGVRYLVIFVLPIAAGGTILSQRILSLVYGKEFLDPSASMAFIILLWGALVMFVNLISITALNSMLKEKKVMKTYVVGIFANVVLNFFLIPAFGIIGAAFATLLAEIMLFCIFYFSLKNEFQIDFSWILKPLFAVAVMALFELAFFNQNIFFLVGFCAIIYFAALYFINGFSQQDKEIFFKVFGIKK